MTRKGEVYCVAVEVYWYIMACKYIFKYINNGPDKDILLEEGFVFYEYKPYINSCYISLK